MTNFTEMTDDQLRSAILNITDPKSELRKAMIGEANRRFMAGIDLTRTCQTGGAWTPFFKEIATPAWSNAEACPNCGKFELLVNYKDEDLCVSCRNDKYPGWAEWWGFNTKLDYEPQPSDDWGAKDFHVKAVKRFLTNHADEAVRIETELTPLFEHCKGTGVDDPEYARLCSYYPGREEWTANTDRACFVHDLFERNGFRFRV
jgi:hypothetical protein